MFTRMLYLVALLILSPLSLAQCQTPVPIRARSLGIPFEGSPGLLDAITDVKGVTVGNTTLISGSGPLKVGEGPVRTGVTVVFPRGKDNPDPVYAGWFSLNGNGEMTGTTWIEESGFLEGPVALTNTHSVGTVRDSIIGWSLKHDRLTQAWSLPVVAETWDGWLNDINGFHVKPEDVFDALDHAAGGPIAEGNVGGGTGMICYGFKGGIGTASRTLSRDEGGYTVGVLVQCNCGRRPQLTIAGVPVGKEIPQDVPYSKFGKAEAAMQGDVGSIIIVVATDAPLLPHQLKRMARRVSLGLARTGSTSGNSSGDIFIAFSTANPNADREPGPNTVETISNERISPLFTATVEATEEAIVNAMVGATTMTGADGRTVIALPHEELQKVLEKYKR
ncbi:P1 family peptidase [Acidobacterium sp. S8]|uniref:DmpA family aminopeptidase n=1 Tax=Acidobacterium sp. S8 TaxID=1641854 RepID=UPI001C20693B|nr:P1 family peptidase [Acidobacterium sp. S8]